MFTRVRRWAQAVQPGLPVGLLHGKRRFNKEWHELVNQVRFGGIDEYGCADEYDDVRGSELIPAEWFLGHKRGLLMPFVVGTVDHLLHAATQTRHVMLRHAGLAGRVVVLDEVHAYDVYMTQFLAEELRWLADAGVPVVLLSATLPPAMRAELARAYLQGALGVRDLDPGLPTVDGYPSALAVCAAGGAPSVDVRCAAPWRPSVPVRVDVLDERPDDVPAQVAELLAEELRDGGCALVVHNTVRRAQQTYLAARKVFGDDTVLLHARLAMGERVDRTEEVLRRLGPNGDRPQRLVVVATQLAEQSFDVDVDLLVTDLAPIDLLLQRIGRLHRHHRTGRPSSVASPRTVIIGMARRDDAAPWLPPGSSAVYGDHLLLRAAALVLAAEGEWSMPVDVPRLVALGYGDHTITPLTWTDTVHAAAAEWAESERTRRARAARFLLAGQDELGKPTLAGLHDLPVQDLPDDDAVAAVVRDGEPSVEVVLVRHDGRNYLTLDGRSIGPNGEAVSDDILLERVLHSTIRLPAYPELTAAAERDLRPLSGWTGDPWLSRTRALPLDSAVSAQLAGHLLSYDPELGLLHERPNQARRA
jgi:CRISPR-associated endonuclease/helicase Cas3